MERKFWTYEIDGEIMDAECESEVKAQEYADAVFFERCEDEGVRGCADEDIVLIEFSFDDDGERIIHQRKDSLVEYEYYRGDRAEHGYP